MDASSAPRAEFQHRLSARQQAAARLAVRDDRLSLARGLVFLAGLVLLVTALATPLSAWWLVAPVVVFSVLVLVHQRVIERLQRARRAVTHYETGLCRLDGRWADVGPTGERYRDDGHPYAADLDLFGR
ncbi:MAG: MutS-related protein, partial [Planctomycetaceae bacterium]